MNDNHNINANDTPTQPKAKTFTDFMEGTNLLTQITINFAFLIPVVLGLSAGLWLLATLATKALAREFGVIK